MLSNDFGFIVISPAHNLGRIKSTVTSILSKTPDVSIICVVQQDVLESDFLEMQKICPTYKAGNTITSLLNTGLENGHNNWNVFVVEGSYILPHIPKKLLKFAVLESDVLFPIVIERDRCGRWTNLHDEFDQCTINGLTIHKKTYEKVGGFSENPLEISKLFWAWDAKNKGCHFKAVLGARIV